MYRLRLSLLTLVLLGFSLATARSLQAQTDQLPPRVAAQQDPALRDKASYCIGLNIGRGIRGDKLDVNNDELVKGLLAGLQGQEVALSENQIREILTAFTQQQQQLQAARNLQEGAEFLAKNKQRPQVTTLPSGLQYEVLKSGNGPSPKPTDRVKTHYHGTLLDGTVFDSSVERKEPITFGVSQVIKGWTEALLLMQVGDKWKLYVPSDLAYRERGAGGVIGPNQTLIFEVELLGIE